MRTRTVHGYLSEAAESGSAALEVLFLMIFIILPVLVLLFNMGYNGMRQREAQNALRLGAFLFVDKLTTGDATSAKNSAQSKVNLTLFKNQQDPATLSVTGQNSPPQPPAPELPDVEGLFARASFRNAVGVELTRTPPYDIFPSTPINRSMVVAANTFTYCEFQDKLFNSSDSAALMAVEILGKGPLWLFGWIPPEDDVCQ